MHLSLGHREFRPLPPKQVVAFSDLIVGISFSIEIQVSLPLLHVPAFSSVAEPTVPSADFSKLFLSPHGNSSTSASFETSPGNAHLHSRLCLPHLRPCFPCRYRALKIYAFSPSMTASYVIPVRQASALPAASFRFHLAMDTLAVKLVVPPTGSTGDFHSLEDAPCRAHIKKRVSIDLLIPRLLWSAQGDSHNFILDKLTPDLQIRSYIPKPFWFSPLFSNV